MRLPQNEVFAGPDVSLGVTAAPFPGYTDPPELVTPFSDAPQAICVESQIYIKHPVKDVLVF